MPSRDEIKYEIRVEIQRLAIEADNDASHMGDDDLIPAMGLLDSMALLILITWFEKRFNLAIPEAEITIDNFGTINLMTSYAIHHSK